MQRTKTEKPDGLGDATLLGRRLAEVSVSRRVKGSEKVEPASPDLVAVEEPLEIRVAGETVGVLMRTPGDDHRLTLGYLFAEGIIRSADDVSQVFHCGRPDEEGYGNTIEVSPSSSKGLDFRFDERGRASPSTSACGVCGRRAVSDLVSGLSPPEPGFCVSAAEIAARVEALRHDQPVFARTGGAHVASLYLRDGSLVATHEDVGRHNAVDKVVGALLILRDEQGRAGKALEPGLIAVSSRAGFEVVQKAARARIPVVATVSAPTSLAVELAERAGITLAAFVRDGKMNVYAHAERIGSA